jgi:hypothetical protein
LADVWSSLRVEHDQRRSSSSVAAALKKLVGLDELFGRAAILADSGTFAS